MLQTVVQLLNHRPSRAERKAETLRAAKRGELLPAGEGQSPVKK